MKKFFFGILAFVLLVLSGCEGTPFAPDFAPLRAFSLSMTAQINEKAFAGTFICDSGGALTLSFTDPPELACFSVREQDGALLTDTGGAADAFGADELPPGAPLRLLFDAVRAAVFTNHGAFVRDKTHGVYTAELTVNGGPVTATFDEDGRLTSLLAPGLTAAFAAL